MQEKYPNISTYIYTANNPVKFIDPDGKDIRFFIAVQDKRGDVVNKQVSFSQLSKKAQNAFLFFAITDLGKEFLSNFIDQEQKFGSVTLTRETEFNQNLDIVIGALSTRIYADGGAGDELGLASFGFGTESFSAYLYLEQAQSEVAMVLLKLFQIYFMNIIRKIIDECLMKNNV